MRNYDLNKQTEVNKRRLTVSEAVGSSAPISSTGSITAAGGGSGPPVDITRIFHSEKYNKRPHKIPFFSTNETKNTYHSQQGL
jgi:hypothetical protein